MAAALDDDPPEVVRFLTGPWLGLTGVEAVSTPR